VEPERLRFARSGVSFAEARDFITRVEAAKKVIVLQQTAEPYGPSRDFARVIASALDPTDN
jgi:hypothetical protein